MASSGTYAYAPDIAEFSDEAWERCGVDPATLTGRHLRSARRSLNLLFVDWANEGVRLFAVDEQTQVLTDGDPSYAPATGTVVILEAFVRRAGIDTPVTKISREDYAAIPDKTLEGLPTQLFYDRKAGFYYLWNVPENSTDELHYWRMRRIQDVTAATETPDVPYQWFEALAAGLAAKLAVKFATDRLDKLTQLASVAFMNARREDRERADTTMEAGI
jgi:hypothetical protein